LSQRHDISIQFRFDFRFQLIFLRQKAIDTTAENFISSSVILKLFSVASASIAVFHFSSMSFHAKD